MCFWERVIIKLYFPQFKSPSASRFQNFFFDLNKYENSKGKKKEISYKIFPDKIMQGEDKRSSIIIKNIPKNMKKKDIRKMVEKYGNINFLSIIKDGEKENYMKAYINVINYKDDSNRTIGLDECVEKVFTSTTDKTKTNISFIRNIRNKSTHLILPEFDFVLAPAFQRCLTNYNKFFKKHFPDYNYYV